SLEKQYDKVFRKAKSGDKVARETLIVLDKLKECLSAGKPARSLGMDPKLIKDFSLLTAKPVLFVGNTDEKADPARVAELEKIAAERGAQCATLCSKLEAEIAQLPEDDRKVFM